MLERDWTFFRDAAVETIFADIRGTQARLGIHFDVYSNEANFFTSGAIWQVLERLRERGHIYDAEDAVWLRTTAFGADKDRVLVRSTGEPTYRLPDIAYHIDKLERGFDLIVDVLGADHIAAVPDIISAVRALGYDADRLRPLVYQFVTLMRHGEVVKMSTRKANYVTLDELIDEVGADAVRFFLLMRSADAPIEFDLDLAKRQENENPLYYVQYAHARTAGILEPHGAGARDRLRPVGRCAAAGASVRAGPDQADPAAGRGGAELRRAAGAAPAGLLCPRPGQRL